jgi:hypothetical protein
MKAISRIKFENLFLCFWIPLAIDQIIRANENSKGLAIIIETIFLFGIYFIIRMGRKDFKKEASNLDKELQRKVNYILKQINCIKKETLIKAKSIFHKRNASKSLSYSIIIQIS